MSLQRVVLVGKEAKLFQLVHNLAKEVFSAEDLTEAYDLLLIKHLIFTI